MRKIGLWNVEWTDAGILDGSAKIVAGDAEDAIAIARQAVESEGGKFELRSMNPVFNEKDNDQLMVLWDEETPGSVAPSETVVEHEGKKYAAGAKMPTLEMVQDSPEETTPRDPVNTDLEKHAAKELATAAKELQAMADDGKVVLYPKETKDA